MTITTDEVAKRFVQDTSNGFVEQIIQAVKARILQDAETQRIQNVGVQDPLNRDLQKKLKSTGNEK